MFNINQLASFAFKNHCSFFGGKPYSNVLKGYLGQLVFFFNPKHKNNYFYQWVRANFDHTDYIETTLFYKNAAYSVVFLKVHQEINSKFLFSFKAFTSKAKHLVSY